MAPHRQYQQTQPSLAQYSLDADHKSSYSNHGVSSTDHMQPTTSQTTHSRPSRPRLRDRTPSNHSQRSQSQTGRTPRVISPPMPRSKARSSPMTTPTDEVASYFPMPPTSLPTSAPQPKPSFFRSTSSMSGKRREKSGLNASTSAGNAGPPPAPKERKGSHEIPKKVGSALKKFFVKKDESDGETEYEHIGHAKHWTDM